MKRSSTTRFRATYSREVTSRTCDPRRNLFTPVFTRPDSSTLVSRSCVAGEFLFFLFCGMFFSFLLWKVRDSAAWNLKPRTKKKTVQLSRGCNSVCEPQKEKKKGQLLRLPRRFFRFISINLILSLFEYDNKRELHILRLLTTFIFSHFNELDGVEEVFPDSFE